MAIGAELSEEEMEEAYRAGELLAPVEVSGIKKVMKWIREQSRGSVAPPSKPWAGLVFITLHGKYVA